MADLTSEEADQASNDLEKRIVEAFDVFDHGGSKTVDVREVGTILRALGCCPTEADIQEIIIQVEDQETSGSVQLERFLPVVSQLIQENNRKWSNIVAEVFFRVANVRWSIQLDAERSGDALYPRAPEVLEKCISIGIHSTSTLWYPPASPERLLKAFQTLDPKGQGFLTKEFLSRTLTDESGGVEPFSKEELDEMLAVAVNNESGTIAYEDFINLLMDHLIQEHGIVMHGLGTTTRQTTLGCAEMEGQMTSRLAEGMQ